MTIELMIHEQASLLRHGVMSCDLNTASVMLPITACAGCPCFLSCRFKDGSIVEAVVWKGKGAQRHRVVEQVRACVLSIILNKNIRPCPCLSEHAHSQDRVCRLILLSEYSWFSLLAVAAICRPERLFPLSDRTYVR